MSVVTGSPPILSEGVLIRSYVAHIDGLKDAAPMRAGECRPHSCAAGMATGLKLIGPDRGNYRDWVLEGLFEMTRAATGEKTRATRMFNRDRKFFISVKDLLKTGKTVEFVTCSMSKDWRQAADLKSALRSSFWKAARTPRRRTEG
jgi:hypothetical protein